MKLFIIHEDRLFNLLQISEIWMETENLGNSDEQRFNIMGNVPNKEGSSGYGSGFTSESPSVTESVCLASFPTKEEQESVFNRLKSELGVMLTEEQRAIEQLSIEL